MPWSGHWVDTVWVFELLPEEFVTVSLIVIVFWLPDTSTPIGTEIVPCDRFDVLVLVPVKTQ